jgi:4-diphosphocytidyl-2-C-methyl-D-erythritol kinase
MLSLQVPAKINLDLRVGRAREDGFHPLSSWFVTVDLCDTLALDLHPQPHSIQLTCSDPALETDGRNMVVRAASDLLLSLPPSHPARSAGVSIHLTKRIPTGGGLGGGSSDAAYTLLGLSQLLQLGLSREHLHRLAERLGSDVNFFLEGPSALCTGRGEQVRRLPAPAQLTALLFLPPIRMPTPAVFRKFDELGLGSPLPSPEQESARYASLVSQSAGGLLRSLVNDLEVPAFALAPELGALRSELADAVGRPVRMSGSGSTLFTLFDSPAEAEQSAERLRKQLAEASVRVTVAGVCPELAGRC